jgi:imidazolonepropionase-like amidohydrolase
MRLDSVLDSVYVLSSLWGLPTSPQTCPAGSSALPVGIHQVAWSVVPETPPGVTAFIDVNVIPMDIERVLASQTVLVENGRITALGPANQVQVPAGAVRIDGKGKYLIPGLANMHPHGRLTEAQLQEARTQNWLFGELAIGVTTMRHLVGGTLTPEQLRKHFETGKVPSPRMYIAPRFPGAEGGTLPRPDTVGALVAAAKAAGYHHIGWKLGSKLINREPEMIAYVDSLVAAARRVKLSLADHSHRLPFGLVLAIGTTNGSIEHLSGVFYDTLGIWNLEYWKTRTTQAPPTEVSVSKIAPLAALLKQSGVWVTPTLDCHLKNGSHTQVVSVASFRAMTKSLQDAGVGLFLSGDDGGNIHDELAALVRAGLTPYQALVTGTRNPAQYLRLQDSSGTVAVGKWADLVLLSGNPLADVQHAKQPVGVMIAGQWLDRARLDQGLSADGTP